jgi:DNA-binding IclR family transcriptional regulator
LADRADAAVRVGAMHGATVVVVHHVFRPGTALQIPEVGAELPVHASALGRALLAFAGSDVLDDLLAEAPPKLTSRTLAPGALRKELAAVAEGGVARERDEAVLGESRVAPRSSITPVTP